MSIEDFFKPILGKKAKGRSGPVRGFAIPRLGRRGGGRVNFSASQAKATIQGMARKANQAIVKKTNSKRVKNSTGKNLAMGAVDYVTRQGKLEFEDQHGIIGNDPKAVIEDWWTTGKRLPDKARRWETVNLVVSTPVGTTEDLLKDAARDFANKNFDGYQYIFVVHHPDTDPDPEPSLNPHVHFVIKKSGYDASRLWLNKADLFALRVSWAEKLTERGIETIATTRGQHLNPRIPQTREQRHAGGSTKIGQISEKSITRFSTLMATLAMESPKLASELETALLGNGDIPAPSIQHDIVKDAPEPER